MKKLLNASLAVAVLALAIFSSCSKGSNGATGATGPAGPDSVFSSGWFTLAMHDSVVAVGDTIFVEGVTTPNVTQGILDSGVVLAYIAVDDANGNTIEENAAVDMEITMSVGYLYLQSSSDYSQVSFRYVVIPGKDVATIASTTGLTRSELQKLSPDKLSAALKTAGISSN
ncbi:hypothetical protein [Dinghuibacter silviterrae]|uniref:Lipoprotein n=1 Tax=Dinghuibacter silviterrae TaxID=1539049 RepID=A0A4R8DUC8_9BACT|nr:hypothetical protein [Dinghuibacter silviterrae]TDX01972.1 hypothetical protein EDB95_3019 [Dinghuibacter silviterrae]